MKQLFASVAVAALILTGSTAGAPASAQQAPRQSYQAGFDDRMRSIDWWRSLDPMALAGAMEGVMRIEDSPASCRKTKAISPTMDCLPMVPCESTKSITGALVKVNNPSWMAACKWAQFEWGRMNLRAEVDPHYRLGMADANKMADREGKLAAPQ